MNKELNVKALDKVAGGVTKIRMDEDAHREDISAKRKSMGLPTARDIRSALT